MQSHPPRAPLSGFLLLGTLNAKDILDQGKAEIPENPTGGGVWTSLFDFEREVGISFQGRYGSCFSFSGCEIPNGEPRGRIPPAEDDAIIQEFLSEIQIWLSLTPS
jgi:hypothetical protein